MQLTVDGRQVFASTGGRVFDRALPTIVFLHGAGCDRTGWTSLARWAAHHGWSVLAPDLPGHGRSQGPPLATVMAMSTWVENLLAAAGIEQVALAGHSMGGAIALETAARLGGRVSHLILIGTAATIAVGPPLLEAARAAPQKAYDMMTTWALSPAARHGRSPAPGVSVAGAVHSVFASNADDVLAIDLTACSQWTSGPAAAARVVARTHVVAADLDIMTSPGKGRELASLIPACGFVQLAGVGHMIMLEAPDALQAVIREALASRAAAA